MQEMMKEFSHVPIGLSDHTQNNYSCMAAMALGADLVERHFTDRMDRQGPDIVCSMDEAACAELIAAAKEIPLMRGGDKKALAEEQVTIDFAFATAVTIKPIRKGEVFTKENLWVKRPGTGEIPAEKYTDLLGKEAATDIGCDVQLTWSMVRN
jgi:sialic acid synthase SpsE